MPESVLIKFGEFMGFVLTKVMPNRYKRSIVDIKKVFPKKTNKECQDIARNSWINMGRIIVEFAKASKMTEGKILSKFRFENCEGFFKDNHEGKGGILLLGHFANWELLGLATAIKAKKMAFVAYPQNNHYVDEYITKLRSAFGSTMISSRNPFFASCRALKRGTLLAVLPDQSVGASKLYMNFLNRPAEISPLPAMLSLKAGVPIYCLDVFREGKQIVARCTDVLYPPKEKYSTQVLYDFSKVIKNKIESNIIKHPSDWLWAHNRWKRENEVRAEMEKDKIRDHQKTTK